MHGIMRLGKHMSLTLTDEQIALQEAAVSDYNNSIWYDVSKISAMPNPVFLYETAQLGDNNTGTLNEFVLDMQHYLDLPTPLTPMQKHRPDYVFPDAIQAKKNSLRINICKDEYQPVRDNLMSISRRNSQWLREVFMESPGVYYSNKAHMLEILDGWMHDPCETRAASSRGR
jgi:hypothetical protein